MRTITQKIYIAEDGKEFITKTACAAYEAEIKKQEEGCTYWKIIHQPDLTEGRGWYGLLFVKIANCQHIDAKVMLEDYCFRTFGRPVAFIQGCAAMENWRITKITKEDYFIGGEIKVGDYSYKGKGLVLLMGEREKGLVPNL